MEDVHQADPIHKPPVPVVRMLVKPRALHGWFALLQQGFLVEARLNGSVRAILSNQIGLPSEYLEERVQTVFLDGKAIDDLESAVLTEGSVLALSAAMPGLVGAAYRRGGYYATLRSETTHHLKMDRPEELVGFFTLKLFNLVANDLGKDFLRAGILVRTQAFFDFLKSQPEDFRDGLREVELDGVSVDFETLKCGSWQNTQPLISLRVISKEWEPLGG